MSRYISCGIDIGTLNTRVVVAEVEKENGERKTVKILGVGVAETRGVRHGYVVNISDAIKSVREALVGAEKEASVKIKRALVSVGGVSVESEVGSGSIIISRVDGEVTDDDVQKTIEASEGNLKLTNKKIIHRFPLGFRLDNKEVLGRPLGMRGMKLEVKVIFVTCLDQHLNDFIEVVEKCGVEVEDVVASPLAASLVTLSKPQRTAGCVLANIGGETVSVAVFENDQLTSLQIFPLGGTDITNDIALGLKIPLDEAENVKRKDTYGKEYPQKKVDDVVEARLSDIFDLIQTHLKKIGRNELLPAGIIMTGEGAKLGSLEEFARTSLKLPARVVAPHILKTKEAVGLDVGWSVAFGLCVLGFDNSYSSDLFQSNHFKLKTHMRGLREWVKQFLP